MKRAIVTLKDRLISGLYSADPTFPMHLWCRLLPQAVTTLNFLRPSRINPRISAEAILNGQFNYDRTPLAPPGTGVIVYEPLLLRKTWDAHGVDGWYIGGAPDNY